MTTALQVSHLTFAICSYSTFSLVPVTSDSEEEHYIPSGCGKLLPGPLGETHNDFFGLPSNPVSIYHTGPSWPLPSGPQAQRVLKEARPVCTHAISPVWREVGEKIYKYFDSIELKWTSIDPVRFAEAGEEPGPLFLWVGVLPDTLPPDHAKDPVVRCKDMLLEYGITDVEIAFRESIYTRYARDSPQLLDHVHFIDPTVDVRIPFTPALGLQIAPKDFPYLDGTGCLYLCEGGESDRVFLLTARHVALPPSKYSSEFDHRKNNRMGSRRQVIHLGGRAFQNALEAIVDEIGHWDFEADLYEQELAGVEEHIEGENPKTTSDRQEIKRRLAEAEASKPSVSEFYRDITSSWSLESEHILGHVVYAPPISVGTGDSMFTEDWALIELDRERFDWDTFRGNVIHLGSALPERSYQFMKKMYPDDETRAKFMYPRGGLMQLQDFVTYDEFHRPTMLDANGEECFIVVKNGTATGTTLSRATGIESFVREYKDDGIHSTSREIAVYSYSAKDGDFSAPGDSGSVVGDANNRIVGMLTTGAGKADSTDVTYVSPYYFLNECIKQAFPHSHPFPIHNQTPA